jgi:hypothetical protein
MLKLIFIIILIFTSLPDLIAQTGCRRISDGHLFEILNLDLVTFDALFNAGNFSQYCLPLNDPGIPCVIKNPITSATSNGIYGTYSPLTCPIDDVIPLILVSGIAGFLYIRKNHLSKNKISF